MSKEILSSPTNDAVGELEQQVSISVTGENVENSHTVAWPISIIRLSLENIYKNIFLHEIWVVYSVISQLNIVMHSFMTASSVGLQNFLCSCSKS